MDSILHLEGDMIEIKGATRVVSSTSTQAVVEAENKCYVISGSDMEVKKLDLEDGEVSFFGKVASVKIGQSKGQKMPLLKRIFK